MPALREVLPRSIAIHGDAGQSRFALGDRGKRVGYGFADLPESVAEVDLLAQLDCLGT